MTGHLFSRAQIAKELGLAKRTLRTHLAGLVGLKCYRVGRSIRFDEEDLAVIKQSLTVPYPTAASAEPSVARHAIFSREARATINPQQAARELMVKLSNRVRG